MADYAWSNIKTSKGKFSPGDSVSAEKLGVDKEEYESLKEAGSVRETEYPKDLPSGVSPVEHAKKQLAIESGQVVEEEEPAPKGK